MKYEKNKSVNGKKNTFLVALAFIELVLIFGILSFVSSSVFAQIGQNATVITMLNVGNVYPEIINVSIDNEALSVDLVANDTKTVTVVAVVRDYNGRDDINWSTANFFDPIASTYTSAADNNNHYKNTSSFINRTYGDSYTVLVTCRFEVWYYANNATWNASFYVNDTNGLWAMWSDTIVINKLLAVGLPEEINYGTVNATNVSSEQIANVTNFGNVRLNLSLEGYGATPGDGLAMNCSLGVVKNISIVYERYNLTASNTSILGLSDFNVYYTNLTNYTVIRTFGLQQRMNDTNNEAINSTYWRIYVPIGVAGNCSGKIVFGATQATGN